MITLCTKCGINWAKLHSMECDGDENYEVCPECRTDSFLSEPTDFIGYIKCPITGRITNTETGMEYGADMPKEKPRVKFRLQPPTPEKSKQVLHEEMEDAALEQYLKTGSKESYFQAFQKSKVD